MRYTKVAFGVFLGGVMLKLFMDYLSTAPEAASLEQSKALFLNRCSTCHGIPEALEVESYLPSNLKEMVFRMQKKPNSKITPEEAQQIYEYMVYDLSVSHKADLDKEMSALPPAKQAAEQAEIDQIRAKL